MVIETEWSMKDLGEELGEAMGLHFGGLGVLAHTHRCTMLLRMEDLGSWALELAIHFYHSASEHLCGQLSFL